MSQMMTRTEINVPTGFVFHAQLDGVTGLGAVAVLGLLACHASAEGFVAAMPPSYVRTVLRMGRTAWQSAIEELETVEAIRSVHDRDGRLRGWQLRKWRRAPSDGANPEDRHHTEVTLPTLAAAAHGAPSKRSAPRNVGAHIVVSLRTNAESGNTVAGQNTLAKDAGVHRRTILRALDDLESAGLATKNPRFVTRQRSDGTFGGSRVTNRTTPLSILTRDDADRYGVGWAVHRRYLKVIEAFETVGVNDDDTN